VALQGEEGSCVVEGVFRKDVGGGPRLVGERTRAQKIESDAYLPGMMITCPA
jgi:hypothetical protein